MEIRIVSPRRFFGCSKVVKVEMYTIPIKRSINVYYLSFLSCFPFLYPMVTRHAHAFTFGGHLFLNFGVCNFPMYLGYHDIHVTSLLQIWYISKFSKI